MTTDERIDKLVDQMGTLGQRVEALTESVELLSHMHQDNEKRFIKYFDRLTGNMEKLAENVTLLSKIAQAHDNRISDLESHDAN